MNELQSNGYDKDWHFFLHGNVQCGAITSQLRRNNNQRVSNLPTVPGFIYEHVMYMCFKINRHGTKLRK